MYKVLIVDDEVINYQLFEKLVDWKEKGFEISGVAGDGLEALQKYDEIKPDLILMDIHLPLMDGLECIQCIRKEDEHVKIVIVSAFGDFSYAQKAIRYGVQDFLLKPVSRLMLNQLVDKLKLLLDEEREGISVFGEKQTRFLTRMIEGKSKEENAEDCFRNMKLCAISILEIDGKRISERRFAEIKEEWKQILHTENIAVYKLENGTIIVIWEDNKDKTIEEELQEIISRSTECYSVYRYEPEKISMEEWIGYLNNIENYGFYEKESKIYKIKENPFTEKEIVCDYLEEIVIKNIVEGSCEGLLRFIDEIFENARKENMDPRILKEQILDLLVRIKIVLKKFDQQDSFMMLRNIKIDSIHKMQKAECLKNFLKDKIKEIFEQMYQYEICPGKGMIFRANAFTEIFYREYDFSVQKVADYIGISKNYFTSQYKEQTGIGFWEYVTNLRMNKAKEMLLTTDEMIGTIARSVGYESEYHFSRKFKEHTGFSPKNYRKDHPDGMIV